MQTTKKVQYTLVMEKSELENMITISTNYLDFFEQESHEVDTYTLSVIHELIDLYDDNEFNLKIIAKLDKITERSNNR